MKAYMNASEIGSFFEELWQKIMVLGNTNKSSKGNREEVGLRIENRAERE